MQPSHWLLLDCQFHHALFLKILWDTEIQQKLHKIGIFLFSALTCLMNTKAMVWLAYKMMI